MQIQVHTDNHIKGSERLTQYVKATVESSLERFRDRITRVEVHLKDETSSSKSRENDKRCVMEARLAGLQPITISHEGTTLEQAIEGAADKMVKTLDRTLGRLDDSRR